MKLALAPLALASIALLEGATAESSAGGQCLSAASSYAAAAGENGYDNNGNAGENGYDNNGNEWNDEAAYYTNANQAQSFIDYTMMGLAQALGMDVEAYEQDQEGQEGEQNQYQDLASQGYMTAYDEDLAQTLGFDEDDKESFAAFYDLTYKLVQQGGCYADGQNQYNQYNADCECAQNNEQGQDDAENNEQEQNADQQEDCECAEQQEQDDAEQDDIVQSILKNCQEVYQGFGIDLQDIEEDNESIKALSINMQIANAFESGQFTIDVDDQGAADYDQGFNDLLEYFGYDEGDIDDDEKAEMMMAMVIRDGALTSYLEQNAAFGTVVDDWEGIFQDFFENIGIEGDFNFEELDTYLATEIYNQELDIEEAGCQQAMINQFGWRQAANYGYVTVDDNPVEAALNYVQMTAGGVAATVIAVAAVVGLVAYTMGKSKGSADKEAPHGYQLDDTAETV